MSEHTTQVAKKRLASLDALRGFDMFWILGGEGVFGALLVLTGWQGWRVFEAEMKHSSWHGFTFYDLIFPLFIFLSGVAMGLSPRRIDALPFSQRKPYYQKAVKRLALLCLLGVIYNHGWGTGMPMAADEIRYASVLGRIAFAWFIAAMLVWHTGVRTQIWLMPGILLGYWLWLCYIPVPGGEAGELTPAGSWNAWVDQHFLPGITYQHRPYDPEGLLSHIPAAVNALAGVLAGRLIGRSEVLGPWRTAAVLFVAGALCWALGWLWDAVFPVNKDLWSSSFVLVTVGWSAMLLALFYVLVDLLPLRKWAYPLVIIGANSIFIYLASSLVNWQYLATSLTGGIGRALPSPWQPLFAVSALLAVQCLVLHWLYRRKLFISV